MRKKIFIAFLVIILAGIAFYFININIKHIQDFPEETEIVDEMLLQPEKFFQYGIAEHDFDIVKNKVKKNEFISDLFLKYGIDYGTGITMVKKSDGIFDVRRLKQGNPYTVLLRSDSLPSAAYFIYEVNEIDFVVYDFLTDSVYTGKKESYVEKKVAQGEIKSSLYVTLTENNLNPMLGMELEEIYGWVIDFYRLQKGDKFKIIYIESFVEGKSSGIERVVAAEFTHFGNDFYAFYFQPDSAELGNYFDETANSLRKEFLKSPLKYSRVTSGFSNKRFHPVLKVYKPHLGVDYGAPTGTPIRTVGDGIIAEASYSQYNGNYVKVKHNNTYATQYLHMSKIGEGIKPGVKVQQGQTIGYVGSTGLATGPHVCFRFWKNGVQVNPASIKIPPSKPVEEKYKPEYEKVMAELKTELDGIFVVSQQ